METWQTLVATITGILTAGGVAIKIWGNKGGPKFEEMNEEINRKAGKFEEDAKELERRAIQIEKSLDQLESSIGNVKEKLSTLDDKQSDQFRAVWDEISSMSSNITVSLREISKNVGFLTGKIENVG